MFRHIVNIFTLFNKRVLIFVLQFVIHSLSHFLRSLQCVLFARACVGIFLGVSQPSVVGRRTSVMVSSRRPLDATSEWKTLRLNAPISPRQAAVHATKYRN